LDDGEDGGLAELGAEYDLGVYIHKEPGKECRVGELESLKEVRK
jgi:hypothetical protein